MFLKFECSKLIHHFVLFVPFVAKFFCLLWLEVND